MTVYDYTNLYLKAKQKDATEADRLKLLEWCEQYDTESWNGESYRLTNRESLKPLYKVYDDDYVVIDAKFIIE